VSKFSSPLKFISSLLSKVWLADLPEVCRLLKVALTQPVAEHGVDIVTPATQRSLKLQMIPLTRHRHAWNTEKPEATDDSTHKLRTIPLTATHPRTVAKVCKEQVALGTRTQTRKLTYSRIAALGPFGPILTASPCHTTNANKHDNTTNKQQGIRALNQFYKMKTPTDNDHLLLADIQINSRQT